MKPQPASSPVARVLCALRRWARDAWLGRLCIVDRVRGLFGSRKPCAAWDRSGKPAKVGLALEFLERRETPDDVFGLLHAPMLGTGLALLGGQMLTPATVLVDGWSAGRTPTPSPHATATDGWRRPGLADAPTLTPLALVPTPAQTAAGAAAGTASPVAPPRPARRRSSPTTRSPTPWAATGSTPSIRPWGRRRPRRPTPPRPAALPPAPRPPPHPPAP